MSSKWSRLEDMPAELSDRIKRRVLENIAKFPVKVRMPYYFNKKGGGK